MKTAGKRLLKSSMTLRWRAKGNFSVSACRRLICPAAKDDQFAHSTGLRNGFGNFRLQNPLYLLPNQSLIGNALKGII